jgi:hypothetical protein
MSLSTKELDEAKKRIWGHLRNKLPERGVGLYQNELFSLRLAQDVLPNELKKAQLKESLLEALPDRKEVIPWSVFLSKKGTAMGAMTFLFAFIFAPVLGPQATMAAQVNRLEVQEGEVWVNGELVEASHILQEGDQIKTSENSSAHLYFADDSRMSLGPQTQVLLQKVEINPNNRADSSIVVTQEEGRSWVQVLNLVSPKAEFSVNFPGGELDISDKASLDLKVHGPLSEVQVARAKIEVRTPSSSVFVEEGEALALYSKMDPIKVAPEVEDDWFLSNLEMDKEHAERVDSDYKKDAQDRVALLPGHLLYPVKTLREAVQESLTFSDSAKKELVKQHAQNRLDEAQVLLSQGDIESANAMIQAYEEKVQESVAVGGEDESEDLLAAAEKQWLVAQEVTADSNETVEAVESVEAPGTPEMVEVPVELAEVVDGVEEEETSVEVVKTPEALVPNFDPRFMDLQENLEIPHPNESEEKSETSGDSPKNPKPHDNLEFRPS